MQVQFVFFGFSVLALPKDEVKYLFGYFWKSLSPFSKFCVNWFLISYFVYCDVCVLNDVDRTCRWTCSMEALSVPEICFWPGKTRKKLKFFEMHTCLSFGAQLLISHNWRKLGSVSLLLHIIALMGLVASVTARSFFFLWLRFMVEVFSIAAPRKPSQLETRTNLTGTEFFGAYCWNMPRFVDSICALTEICMNCSVVIPFLTISQFFDILFEVGSGLFFKIACFFNHRFW